MMRTSFAPRRALSMLAGSAVLLGAMAAQAASCTTEDEAEEQYSDLVQAAMDKINGDSEPDTLRKDKIGLVLVARAAAASSSTDQRALRRDINALSQQLARPPGDICRAVETIRRKHGL